MTVSSLVFLEGRRVVLRPLLPEDANETYLQWLNDPEVLRYRAPKAFPATLADLRKYIEGVPERGDLHLAICDKKTRRHIGNIALVNILWVHRSAELTIMLGAKDAWGKGHGGDAVETLTGHAFRSMAMHRLWTGSPNPAFNAIMRRLGWTHEGVRREIFLLDGRFVDMECFSILEREYFASRGRAPRSAKAVSARPSSARKGKAK